MCVLVFVLTVYHRRDSLSITVSDDLHRELCRTTFFLPWRGNLAKHYIPYADNALAQLECSGEHDLSDYHFVSCDDLPNHKIWVCYLSEPLVSFMCHLSICFIILTKEILWREISEVRSCVSPLSLSLSVPTNLCHVRFPYITRQFKMKNKNRHYDLKIILVFKIASYKMFYYFVQSRAAHLILSTWYTNQILDYVQ